jgi:ketosteroid isomerase-like protein
MNKYIISLVTLVILGLLISCGKEDPENKSNFQVLADKEKELNDREAALRLKEKELEEREKNLNRIEGLDTSSTSVTDTSKMTSKESEKSTKKEIEKEITRKFENPATTVKDYYEYIQRAIYEAGNFDSNMKKAHGYFPSRSSEKMKASYRNTKMFTVVEEPKVLSQKGDKSTVTSRVKQTDVVKKDGKDQEVTKTLTVTYDLKANNDGQWVIVANSVKVEN